MGVRPWSLLHEPLGWILLFGVAPVTILMAWIFCWMVSLKLRERLRDRFPRRRKAAVATEGKLLCFEVHSNGVRLCRAGLSDGGGVHVIASCLQRSGEDSFVGFSVTGLDSRTGEHVHWVSPRALSVGDELVIRVVESDHADDPIVSPRLDPKMDLVNRITEENRHEEVDWGPAAGREGL